MNDDDADNSNTSDLSNMLQQLYLRYSDFFSIYKAKQQLSHQVIDHAIELKPGAELSYMYTYNLFPVKLKVLEEYINKTLVKS